MIAPVLASILLAAAAVYAFAGNIFAENPADMPFGQAQIIYADVPWGILGVLAVAALIAVATAVKKRSFVAGAVGVVHTGLLGYLTFILLTAGALPEHALARSVGDPFPGFDLVSDSGARVSASEGSAKAPALYVFYRGDW